MNIYLLLIPLFAVLLVDNVLLFRQFSALEQDEQQVMLGGFSDRGFRFWVWHTASLVLSTLGVSCTFFLMATLNEEWIPFALMLVILLSTLVFNQGPYCLP
jgi:hypothetical protein